MKKNEFIRLLGGALFGALLLTGCASSRKATKGDDVTSVVTQVVEKAEFVNTVNANRVTSQALTAKMNLKLSSGTKNVSVGGQFRVKRDDVIQLSLVFLGIKEVGRLELTRDSLLILDRLNNQYLKARYSDIPYLQQAGIDFYSFQSLFWGELFVPNDKGVAPSATAFRQERDGKAVRLTHSDRNLMMTFLAAAASGVLNSTEVAASATSAASVMSEYSNWMSIGGGQFPGHTILSLGTGKTSYKASIELSNIKENEKWETRTVVNTKKYKKVTVESIMRQIMSLAK